jgi:cysteine desulfurase/selenocysteine lyase
MNILNLKAHFPGLSGPHEHYIYLDSAATTQKCQKVIDALAYADCYLAANVHRGAYRLSADATAAFEAARVRMAQFIHAEPDEVIFTKGTTEGLNLLAQVLGSTLHPGDEILISAMEHHANLVPWQLVAQKMGLHLVEIPLLPHGQLDMAALARLLNPRSKIVACTHVSNVLGYENPIKDIVALSHAVGAKVVCDGAQAVAHMPVDVQSLGCDFYAFSGHKMYGPFGIGVLYGRRELLRDMPPWQGGGDMIEHVELMRSTFMPAPQRFEAGTPPISQAIALAAAVDFLEELGFTAIESHQTALINYMYQQLSAIEGLRILGESSHRMGMVSFTLEGVHPHDIATVLDTHHIAIRSGHMCCQPLMKHFALPAVCRASLGIYNQRSDIDALCGALHTAQKVFAA